MGGLRQEGLGRRAWAGGLGRAARYGGPPMVCSLSRGEFPADAITGLCQSGFGVRTAVYAQWVPSGSPVGPLCVLGGATIAVSRLRITRLSRVR